ncbi:FUSC family protein [Mucilaginibacter rubeus]|uniref:FUSC family protein n=1 Tax=Mucilaginibacter rubeus TaxID=2027860 RepID=A0A5C1I4Z8_9SPHI|nr:FUSC family protein [Mucilaginibacter rubeus]QEM13033.1 FUSC family protein [Mucilaginibacter rubeus]
MEQKDLSQLTSEELLQEAKKIKSGNILDAAIIGFLIGVAVYSTVRNGFGFLTFLPLVYLPIATKNKLRNKEVEKLVKEKGLK